VADRLLQLAAAGRPAGSHGKPVDLVFDAVNHGLRRSLRLAASENMDSWMMPASTMASGVCLCSRPA
jgi:hypothetical protein